jgi:YggT family protein
MAQPNPPSPPEPNHHSPASPNGHDPWGEDPQVQRDRQRLAQEAARHTKARKATVLDKFVQGILYLVAALEVLLALRFMLRLTAANPDNTFASVIYGLSRPFVQPFSTLFISPTFNGSLHILDLNVLVAMAAYMALLALFLGFLRIAFDNN